MDADNSFLVITIHHILQGIIALLLIFALSLITRNKPADFGFSTKGIKESIKPVLIFSAVFAIIQIIGTVSFVYICNQPLYLNYKISAYNFTGYFLFEALLSGTSEELLFRSLLLVFVAATVQNFRQGAKKTQIFSVAISCIVFMSCHIGFDIRTFTITN